MSAANAFNLSSTIPASPSVTLVSLAITGITAAILSIISPGDNVTSIVKDLDKTGWGILSCGRFDIKITLPLNSKVFGNLGNLPSSSPPAYRASSIPSSICTIEARGKD